MFYRRFISFAAVLTLALAATASAFADSRTNVSTAERVSAPLNLAILIQDDLTSQVNNELAGTRDFIRSLPRGSRVMVGYITAGALQVRQPFTSDLNQAASSLRILRSSTYSAPFNPYVEVIEALSNFSDGMKGTNAVLLISDGLDTSRGFDFGSPNTIDLERAVKKARNRNVAVYTFYAPSVGLSGHNRLAASFGQGSLNRLANDTGGRAFFQGNGFVTFDSYFQRLSRTLNEQENLAS